MLITYRNISTITFPVFKLPRMALTYQDGLVMLDGLVVDDTNMPGNNLGVRRLQTPHQKRVMYLSRALETHIGILKQRTRTFIDSKGLAFVYRKTKYCRLKYHKIIEVERKITGSLLHLTGINFAFAVPRPPAPTHQWAGILYLDGFPWMLYDYADEKKKTTRKMV